MSNYGSLILLQFWSAMQKNKACQSTTNSLKKTYFKEYHSHPTSPYNPTPPPMPQSQCTYQSYNSRTPPPMSQLQHGGVGRVTFCQKHSNIPAEIFYCVFWCIDQLQKIRVISQLLHCLNVQFFLQWGLEYERRPKTEYP